MDFVSPILSHFSAEKLDASTASRRLKKREKSRRLRVQPVGWVFVVPPVSAGPFAEWQGDH